MLPVEAPVPGAAAEAIPAPTAAVVTKARRSEERQAAVKAVLRVAVEVAAAVVLVVVEVIVEAAVVEAAVVVVVLRARAVALRLLLLTRETLWFPMVGWDPGMSSPCSKPLLHPAPLLKPNNLS